MSYKVADKLPSFLSLKFSADNHDDKHEHDTSAEFSADTRDDDKSAEFLPSARDVRGSEQAAAVEEVRGATLHLHHQSDQPLQLTAQRHGTAGRLTSTVVRSSMSASRKIVI